jgi:hypothetical protein
LHQQQRQYSIDNISPTTHQRTDLEDTFDISEEDQEDNHLIETEYHQLLPSATGTATTTTSTARSTSPAYIQQHSTDGVFSNMSAKPESDSKVEEVPPVSFGKYCMWLIKEKESNLVHLLRPTKKLLQMQRHLTGKQRSLHLLVWET